jgi:pimeloyl-ACP methyl ester carboxylesterase
VSDCESFLPDLGAAGVISHFKQAELVKIEGASHWLRHDKPDEALDVLKTFLEGSGSD